MRKFLLLSTISLALIVEGCGKCGYCNKRVTNWQDGTLAAPDEPIELCGEEKKSSVTLDTVGTVIKETRIAC